MKQLRLITIIVLIFSSLSLVGCISVDALLGGSSDGDDSGVEKNNWGREVNIDADLIVGFSSDDIQVNSYIPTDESNEEQSKNTRIRIDLELSRNVKSLVSIKRQTGDATVRLMRGALRTNVAGDYFYKEDELDANSVVIFANINSAQISHSLKYDFLYISQKSKTIKNASKTLNIEFGVDNETIEEDSDSIFSGSILDKVNIF
jgi:hypothetical protein